LFLNVIIRASKVSVPALYCQLMNDKGIVRGQYSEKPIQTLGTLESPEAWWHGGETIEHMVESASMGG
jgi:hypothetical protein